MDARNPTTAALADLLVKVITGVEGGTDEHWRGIIGAVHQLPIVDNVRSNWCVVPGGKPRERKVIVHAAEIIRQAHPYVNG
ncbi:hypothetical protein [Sphingomonas rubra]|uniref:Uncharacterized protein n=1 Tax=Sphingomonas rubra TaxID=634430 RepID=A0A1I5UYY9_9SPHN|nr:hypothetical protein [Sphingomonas rubra]SFP99906.1 hypothetical protein SAMN04488241_11914 [Sphingomonas rubra]